MDTTNPYIIPEANFGDFLSMSEEEIKSHLRGAYPLDFCFRLEQAQKELVSTYSNFISDKNREEDLFNALKLICKEFDKHNQPLQKLKCVFRRDNQECAYKEAEKLCKKGGTREAKELLLAAELIKKLVIADKAPSYSGTSEIFRICQCWAYIINDRTKALSLLDDLYRYMRDNLKEKGHQPLEMAFGKDFANVYGGTMTESGCAGLYWDQGEKDKARKACLEATDEYIRMLKESGSGSRNDPEGISIIITKPLLKLGEFETAQKVYDKLYNLYSSPDRHKECRVEDSKFQPRLEQALEEMESLIWRTKKYGHVPPY